MIYLDLDGVFADFNKKAIELIGPDYKEIKANELWKESKNNEVTDQELEELDNWAKTKKKMSPFADKGIKYHVKARYCKDEKYVH